MKTLKLSLIGAAVLLSTSAMANVAADTGASLANGTKTLFKTATNPAAVSLEVGTLGYGANIAWSANDRVELQAGWAGTKLAKKNEKGNHKVIKGDFQADGVNYEAKVDFSNPYLGVQLRPIANWLTVGAGVIVPDNKITVTAKQSQGGTYRIGGKDYKQDNVGVLKGKLTHRNTLAPYLTVGFRPNINNHWGIFGEVGGAYLGNADATIDIVGTDDVVSTDGASTITRKDLAKQAQKDIEDKKFARWLPIAKVGATYRF